MVELKIDLDKNKCKIESNPLLQVFHLIVDEGDKESISKVVVESNKAGDLSNGRNKGKFHIQYPDREQGSRSHR